MSTATVPSPSDHTHPPEIGHDHEACVARALEQARRVCARSGARLTDLRLRVLEIVWTSHKPVGAYDVLRVLTRHEGRLPGPPTVYRALEFLMEQGLVHRIESLNAYVGCDRPGHAHRGLFLLCRSCGAATEIEDEEMLASLAGAAGALGFLAERMTVEVTGRCHDCATR